MCRCGDYETVNDLITDNWPLIIESSRRSSNRWAHRDDGLEGQVVIGIIERWNRSRPDDAVDAEVFVRRCAKFETVEQYRREVGRRSQRANVGIPLLLASEQPLDARIEPFVDEMIEVSAVRDAARKAFGYVHAPSHQTAIIARFCDVKTLAESACMAGIHTATATIACRRYVDNVRRFLSDWDAA